MDFKALKEKYQQLLLENNRLREEIKRLRTQLGMDAIHEESQGSANKASEFLIVSEPELFDRHIETKPLAPPEAINKLSDASAKIRLFQSLFKGREDVYAKKCNDAEGSMLPIWSSRCCRKVTVWKWGSCMVFL